MDRYSCDGASESDAHVSFDSPSASVAANGSRATAGIARIDLKSSSGSLRIILPV